MPAASFGFGLQGRQGEFVCDCRFGANHFPDVSFLVLFRGADISSPTVGDGTAKLATLLAQYAARLRKGRETEGEIDKLQLTSHDRRIRPFQKRNMTVNNPANLTPLLRPPSTV